MKPQTLVMVAFLVGCGATTNEEIKVGDDVSGPNEQTPDDVQDPVDDDPGIDTSPFDGPDTAVDDEEDPNNNVPYPVDTGFGGGLGIPNLFDSGLLGGFPGLGGGGGGGLWDSGGLLGGGGNPLGGLFDTSDTGGGFLWFRPTTLSYGSADGDLFEFP